MTMRVLPYLLCGFLCAAGLAQEAKQEQAPTFRSTVNVVIAPVTVTDRDGSHVSGLEPKQFRLFDNGKDQTIKVDVSYVPISLVVAVQASWNVDALLPKIQKIGPLLENLVLGERGEAAVMAFDHRLQVLEQFTSDGDRISAAMRKIKAGSSSSRMIDAVSESTRMLRARNPDHRKILLLISETRDRASEGRLRETLMEAQINNILVYTVNINRLVTTLTAKPMPPRPDAQPPAARGPLPMGQPSTPTTLNQTFGSRGYYADFIPAMVELFRAAKMIFVDNPAEYLTKGTGGKEFSFSTQRGLEDAISAIGQEVHSQYLVTYNPNNKEEAGFHEIQVLIQYHPEYKTRTRPGYWLAAVYQ